MSDYKKLKYVGEELVKSKLFLEPGVYTLPVGFSLGLWIGKRAHEMQVITSNTVDFTSE